MGGKALKYFAEGHTADGFYSLYDCALARLDRIFILIGGPGMGKSTLMKKIANNWIANGYDIEMIYSISDRHSIDGVIIPSLKVGVVDGTAPHVMTPKAPGAIEVYVNLGVGWNTDKLIPEKEKILAFGKEERLFYEKAYDAFAMALEIHDQWEKIYIKNMDFLKANVLAKQLEKDIFADKRLEKESIIKHRFLGAATPTGPVHFIENITADLPKRYFIKGRAGTGKSTLQKKLIASAEERGIDMEIYHCGFDPKSIDMVVFRELGIAIFDSTPPHEVFQSRPGDEVVDMYQKTISHGTDETYADEIKEISQKYKEKMKTGTAYLAKALAVRDQLKDIYIKAMDFSKVEQLREEIEKELSKIAQAQIEI